MRALKTILSIIQGNALVIIQREDNKADVVVGKLVNKRFAINSMVGAVKALM